MAKNSDGVTGEVHRFEREEQRPDLILVSDRQKCVLIIEAKDSMDKLMEDQTIKKTVRVFEMLSAKLQAKAANPFWKNRSAYVYLPGLLWGTQVTGGTPAKLFREYLAHTIRSKKRWTKLVGIETRRAGSSLTCETYFYPRTLSRDLSL